MPPILRPVKKGAQPKASDVNEVRAAQNNILKITAGPGIHIENRGGILVISLQMQPPQQGGGDPYQAQHVDTPLPADVWPLLADQDIDRWPRLVDENGTAIRYVRDASGNVDFHPDDAAKQMFEVVEPAVVQVASSIVFHSGTGKLFFRTRPWTILADGRVSRIGPESAPIVVDTADNC